MLEPREADIPALFLVFVVLPLPAYVLLGKWSEASKKSERVRLLAQLASEEAVKAEAMVVPDIIPLVSSSKNNVHACARCSRPTITRLQICQILSSQTVLLRLVENLVQPLLLKLALHLRPSLGLLCCERKHFRTCCERKHFRTCCEKNQLGCLVNCF